MSSFTALCAKETMALFRSPIAYAVIAVFLLVIGYSFTGTLFLNKTAGLIHVFLQASVMMLLIVPVLVVMQLGVIAREERYLERKFGDEYLRYKARVRRWL